MTFEHSMNNDTMRYKYVVFENNGDLPPAIICSMGMSHDDFAADFPGTPISAGYCYRDRDDNKWRVYGVSTSLNLFSRPEDALLLNESE